MRKPPIGIIRCLLCGAALPATARRVDLLARGRRIFCPPCNRKVKASRAYIGSVLAKPFRAMLEMAAEIEKRAAAMIDGEHIRLIAALDNPGYRDIVGNWSRITGQRVDPLPRQKVEPEPSEQFSGQPDGA